jgi:hypothetical protein
MRFAPNVSGSARSSVLAAVMVKFQETAGHRACAELRRYALGART